MSWYMNDHGKRKEIKNYVNYLYSVSESDDDKNDDESEWPAENPFDRKENRMNNGRDRAP